MENGYILPESSQVLNIKFQRIYSDYTEGNIREETIIHPLVINNYFLYITANLYKEAKENDAEASSIHPTHFPGIEPINVHTHYVPPKKNKKVKYERTVGYLIRVKPNADVMLFIYFSTEAKGTLIYEHSEKSVWFPMFDAISIMRSATLKFAVQVKRNNESWEIYEIDKDHPAIFDTIAPAIQFSVELELFSDDDFNPSSIRIENIYVINSEGNKMEPSLDKER